MKTPKGIKDNDGNYKFFVADTSGDGHTGRFLIEHEFIKEMIGRGGLLPRCADPRCNVAFEQERADQIYHTRECGNRHKSRMRYRESIGMPDDAPVDRPADERETEIRAAVELARQEIDRRVVPPVQRTASGMIILRSKNQREEVTLDKLTPLQKYMAFITCMRLHGYILQEDFVSTGGDEIEELFQLYCTQGGKLTKAQITPLVDQEAHAARLEAERTADAARQANDLPRPRSAGDPVI